MSDRELVEQVTRAIYEARHNNMNNCYSWDDGGLDDEHPDYRESCMRDARAAILATLKGVRDATPEMIDVGIPVICCGLPATDTFLDQLCAAPNCGCYSRHGLKVTPAVFRAMVDRRIKLLYKLR